MSSQLEEDARLAFGVSVPIFSSAWIEGSQIDTAGFSVGRVVVEVTASVDVRTGRIVSC